MGTTLACAVPVRDGGRQFLPLFPFLQNCLRQIGLGIGSLYLCPMDKIDGGQEGSVTRENN